MTNAPENLRQVRGLLLTHLGPHGLSSGSVGVVGDTNHRGGYHCGSDRVLRNADGSIRDYSVIESRRDRDGLTLDAAGLDVGLFEARTPKGTFDLAHFSRWCAAECAKKAPDARDIREVIYSPDGRIVRRYDALGYRSSGDDSHLWHTHFSFFRDAIKAGRDQTPLFRRYLTTIGLLEADTMSALDATKGFVAALNYARNPDAPHWSDAEAQYGRQVRGALLEIMGSALAARDFTDEPAIIQGVLAGLPTEKLVAALTEAQARALADELARRLAS